MNKLNNICNNSIFIVVIVIIKYNTFFCKEIKFSVSKSMAYL